MRIKKWEKIYWGIIFLLAALITIIIFAGKFRIIYYGKEVDWSNTKKFLTVVPSFLGFFLIIWLIVRLFDGGENK
ncbi:MAG: hypothetical protein MRERV_6c057 [Mycoplasmataceae bacterium RV_VA103A]|nr:MAG: hypothetical protein MRERV_6c057 [Mycoplasmataceae bacterium RV_VA103A]